MHKGMDKKLIKENRPLIISIRRDSFEDGPGIRSVVFFKGCPLRCVFCHNPEGQYAGVEIAFSPDKCTGCASCLSACQNEAIAMDGPERILRDRCVRCGQCATACPSSALVRIGESYSVEALAEILLRDEPFYRNSGGGVTLSGGEATLYPDYLEALLKELKKSNIHITLETSGHFDYEIFSEKILPYLDLVYYDVKLADPELHKRHLGRSNELILENLARLLKEEAVEVEPRIPLIPSITASRENLRAIVELVFDMGAQTVTPLAYNPLGLDMNRRLGRELPALPTTFMTPEEEEEIRFIINEIIDDLNTCSDNRGQFNETVPV